MSNDTVLAGLDNINWKEEGNEEIPKYLQLLLSQMQNERAIAHNYLEENVIKISNQNYDEGHGISELLENNIPILIVPFLLEVITTEQLQDKARVLDKLIGLALYKTMKYEGDEYENKASLLDGKIFKETKLFLELVEDSDATVRSSAFSLLIHSPSYEQLRGYLTEIAEQEADKDARDFMLRMLEENPS